MPKTRRRHPIRVHRAHPHLVLLVSGCELPPAFQTESQLLTGMSGSGQGERIHPETPLNTHARINLAYRRSGGHKAYRNGLSGDLSGQSLYISIETLPSLSMCPRYIPTVLNGIAIFPLWSMAMTPPVPPAAVSFSMMTWLAASSTDLPR